MRNLLIMLVTVLMLAACSTYSNPKAGINADLLQPCKAVVILAAGDRASVMKNITVNSFNQQDCIDRHNVLVDAVKLAPK